MESKENNWSVGEIVTLSKTKKPLKKSGSRTFVRYVNSRYICIREAKDGQRGILLKVLGKAMADDIAMVNSEPFCKDYSEDLFESTTYFSYPFPSTDEVQEVLSIFREHPGLTAVFEKASMHINPNSTFWVSDTVRNKFFLKKPQILSGRDGQLCTPSDDDNHYRLSIVYFFKGSLIW